MKKVDVLDLIKKVESLNFVSFFDFFKSSDDVLLIKYDGVRETNQFSIMIIGKESRFEIIRYEGTDFILGMRFCLNQYVKYVD